MRIRERLAVLGVGAVIAASAPAGAAVLPFTFAPNGASPPLAGSTFTADTINYSLYLRGVVQPDGTFAAQRIEPITGFTLGGTAVTPAGFGSAYGLYVTLADTGSSAPPGPLTFTSSTYALMADPGNLNGAPSATLAGIGFANTGPTGVADDITLATGTLVASSAGFDVVTGLLSTYFRETFAVAAGQAGFFVAPAQDGSVFLDLTTVNPGSLLISTPQPDGTVIQTVNGEFVGTAQFVSVPEPGSLVVLAAGLMGLGLARRRWP